MVLKRCVYGVDKNQMAVELAKVALWLHSFTVGAPLSFLDHHLRCGDSLFGSWVKTGIERATAYGSPLLLHEPVKTALGSAASMQTIESLPDAEIAEAHRSQEIFEGVQVMTAPLDAFLSFLHAIEWQGLRGRENRIVLQAFFDGEFGNPFEIAQSKAVPRQPGSGEGNGGLRGQLTAREKLLRFQGILAAARELVAEERFLNWQVAFPGVWTDWEGDGLTGGFDAIIGNPPWDRMKLQQVEWFAARRREIALAQKAADRKKMVAELDAAGDPLTVDYEKASSRAETAVKIARKSGDYPMLSGGDVNIYSLFVERALALVKDTGMVGLLTPIGIGADKTAANFFSFISEAKRVKAFLSFENRGGWLFRDVHHEDQPTILVLTGGSQIIDKFKYAVKLTELPSSVSSLVSLIDSEDCRRVNPNTGTVPIYRTSQSGEFLGRIYAHLPILVEREDGAENKIWPVKYYTMFHMTNDSGLFRTKQELLEDEGGYPVGGQVYGTKSGKWLPLYEGKMISTFNHRYAGVRANSTSVSGQGVPVHSSVEQLKDPEFVPEPRYWVAESEITIDGKYVLAFNDVCNTNNKRSLIAALVPRSGYGNKLPVLVPTGEFGASDAALLLGNFCAIVCDFAARQKIQSRNLNKYILEQLPVVPPAWFEEFTFGPKTAGGVVRDAVLELTYTAHGMASFARDVGFVDAAGNVRPPFTWDEERRLKLRAKLDAVFFHLYGITDRDDVRYIYSTFPTLEREEKEAYDGCYRSCELCLAYISALAAGDPDAEVVL